MVPGILSNLLVTSVLPVFFPCLLTDLELTFLEDEFMLFCGLIINMPCCNPHVLCLFLYWDLSIWREMTLFYSLYDQCNILECDRYLKCFAKELTKLFPFFFFLLFCQSKEFSKKSTKFIKVKKTHLSAGCAGSGGSGVNACIEQVFLFGILHLQSDF